MGLPTSRDLTAVDGSSVIPASLLNNIQDFIVASRNNAFDALDASYGLTSSSILGKPRMEACVPAPSGARQVAQTAGWLLQYDGSDILGRYFAEDTLLTTTSIGDGTHPRIDLICVKLTRSATGAFSADYTKQVVEGTPAATPSYPAVPAGYAIWCAVYVPASHNAAHDAANLRDHCYGLRYRREAIRPGQMHNESFATGVLTSSGGMGVVAGAAAEYVWVYPPAGASRYGRVVGFRMASQLQTNGLVELYEVKITTGGGGGGVTTTLLKDLSASFAIGTASLSERSVSFGNTERPYFVDAHCNPFNHDALRFLAVRVKSGGNGDIVRSAEWEIWE